MVSRYLGRARLLGVFCVVGSALGAFGWLWWGATGRSDISFLPRRSPAEWIVFPSVSEPQTHLRVPVATVFKRSFTLADAPAQATVSIAGFHEYNVSLNGSNLAAATLTGAWKRPDTFEAAKQLRPGTNEIMVTVVNTNGPPALWCSLTAGGFCLASDESWQASCLGAAWRPAWLARKPRAASADNALLGGKEPWSSLRSRWPTLASFAGLCVGACSFAGWYRRRRQAGPEWDRGLRKMLAAREPGVADPALSASAEEDEAGTGAGWGQYLLTALVLAALWGALFANNFGVLGIRIGFDAGAHIDYIRYLQDRHALPLASDGWEMFQPPLYYLLAASVLAAFGLSATQFGGVVALRVMGLAIGLAHLGIIWAGLRLMFPNQRSGRSWGVVLAACLPPMLCLSQFVTNEALAAGLVSASVFLTLRLLKHERPSWKSYAGLGLCLGAALLTKVTAVLAVPPIIGGLVWRGLERRESLVEQWKPWRRLLERICLVLAACSAVCGWHYLRVWWHFGSPLVGAWDPRLGFNWWQEPGYGTTDFYLRFGHALAHPWLSSCWSFADGVYSTLWGDGLLSGSLKLGMDLPWNYDLMVVAYWLALLPSAVFLTGSILGVWKFVRRPSAEWFVLLGLALLVVWGMVQFAMAVPYYCNVKAFYGMSAIVPFCACAVLGFEALSGGVRSWRLGLWVLLGLWALNSYASFWILRSSVPLLYLRAREWCELGQYSEAVDALKARLALEPRHSGVRAELADVLLAAGRYEEAEQQAEIMVRENPNDALGHSTLAGALARQQRLGQAVQEVRQAIRAAPGIGRLYEQLVPLLLAQKDYAEAVGSACDGLALTPLRPELHLLLGSARLALGQTNGAAVQFGFAIGLNPDRADAHCRVAMAYHDRRQVAPAAAHYTDALRLNPNLPLALNNLAWIRATHPDADFRNGAEAVRLAERACQLSGHKHPVMAGTLAAAYAEAGDFDKAVATARLAHGLAVAAGQRELAEEKQEAIELFTARQPYREAPAEPSRFGP